MSIFSRVVQRCLHGHEATLMAALRHWDLLSSQTQADVLDELDAASRSSDLGLAKIARIALEVLIDHRQVQNLSDGPVSAP